MNKLFEISVGAGLCVKFTDLIKGHYALSRSKLFLVLMTALFTFGLSAFSATIIVNNGESIQAKIDSAAIGDTVQITAGSYVEQITISRNIALTGAGSATTTIKAPATLPAQLPGDGANRNYVVGVNGVIAIISGLTIDGNNAGAANPNLVGIAGFAGATVTVTDCTVQNLIAGTIGGFGIAGFDSGNLTVTNSVVKDFREAGIVLKNNGSTFTATVTGNTITGSASSVPQSGISLSGASTVLVTNNTISQISGGTITDVAASISLLNNGAGATIVSGNVINGSKSVNEYGIAVRNSSGSVMVSSNTVAEAGFGVVFDGKDGTFSGTISGNDIKDGPEDGAGIFADTATATIMNNSITGNDTGIYLLDDSGSTTIRYNQISGVGAANSDAFFIANETLDSTNGNSPIGGGADGMTQFYASNTTIDAKNNWFGTVDDTAIGAQIRGSAVFVPFLLTGDSDNGATGFTRSANLTLTANAGATQDLAALIFTTIQTAVNFANDGDTVSVIAGSYVEQVTIPKTITLAGAGSSSTIITAPGTTLNTLQGDGIDRSYVLGVNGATVTISGLTIDGNGAGATNPNFAGIAGFAGAKTTVSACTVQKINGGTSGGFGIAAFDSGTLEVTNSVVNTFRHAGIVVRGSSSLFTSAVIGNASTVNTITGGRTGSAGVPQLGVSISGVTTVSVTNNTITQIADGTDVANGISSSISLADNGTSTISGNRITGTENLYEYGIAVRNNTTSVTVSSNIVDKAGFGIFFDGTGGTFSGTISRNNITGAPLNGAGIFVDTVTATITNNSLTGNDTGIFLLDDEGSRINKNEISGIGATGGDKTGDIGSTPTDKGWFISNDTTTDGITFKPATTALDATSNWFGTSIAADIDAQIRGAATISPILTAGDSDGSQIGFEPSTIPNRAPMINTSVAVNVTEDGMASIDVVGDGIVVDPDFADGVDTLSHTILNQPDHGALVFSGATGKGIYTPEANFFGQDQFTLQTTDSKNEQAMGTITINVAAVNDKPTVNKVFVNARTMVETEVPLKVVDVDDTTGFTIKVVNLPAGFSTAIGELKTKDGMTTVMSGTTFTENDIPLLFTSVAGFNGTFKFEYYAKDGGTEPSANEEVRINVGSPDWFPAIDLSTVTSEDNTTALTVSDNERYIVTITRVNFRLDNAGEVDLNGANKVVASIDPVVTINIWTVAGKRVVEPRDYLISNNRGLPSNKQDSMNRYKDEYRVKIERFDSTNMMTSVVVSDRLETVGSDETNANNAMLIIPPLQYDAPTVTAIPTSVGTTPTNPRVITDNENNRSFDFAFDLKSVSAYRLQVGAPVKDSVGTITGIGNIVKERLVRIEPRDSNNGFIQTEGQFLVEGFLIADVGEYVFAVRPINPDTEAAAMTGLAAANVFQVTKKAEFTEKPSGIDVGGILDASMRPGVDSPDFSITGYNIGAAGANNKARITFEWNEVPKTRNYFIYVVEFMENRLEVDTTSTNGELSFTRDLSPGAYRWHIITQNEAGNAPFWSQPKFFFIEPQPTTEPIRPVISSVTVADPANANITFARTNQISVTVQWIVPAARVNLRLASSVGDLFERSADVVNGATLQLNLTEADVNFKLSGDANSPLVLPTYFITVTPFASNGLQGTPVQINYVPEVETAVTGEIDRPRSITLSADNTSISVSTFSAGSRQPTRLVFEAAIKILNPRTRFIRQDTNSIGNATTPLVIDTGGVNNIPLSSIFVNALPTSDLILKIRVRGEADTPSKISSWSRQFLFRL